MKIKEILQHSSIITDGAFGTYYAEKYNDQSLPELANIHHAERVKEIHAEYIAAGSKLIRTNTFAMNRGTLNWSMERIEEGIRRSVAIAREAVAESGKEVFIAGDIGPLSRELYECSEELEKEYEQLADIFLSTGVEIITFETMPDLEYVLPAIRRIKENIREAGNRDLFIMVQFSANQYGYTSTGRSVKSLLQECERISEIDAVGLNCGMGPAHMLQLLHQCSINTKKYFITLPNAGYPVRVKERLQFIDNARYFASKMKEIMEYCGDIAGGCCGTNPLYIRKLAEQKQEEEKRREIQKTEIKEKRESGKKTGFFYTAEGQEKKKPFIAVELAPPMGADTDKLLEAAHILENLPVDVVTFPDSPSGRTRVDSILMAERVKRETKLQVMPHLCCRDKNAIAIRSILLGAYINEIDNFLIVTGDPVPTDARRMAKQVFNFDSVGFMEIVNELNIEQFSSRPMTYGGAINQGRRNLDVEIKRVQRKLEAGATFFFTQPVFDKEAAERIRRIKRETGARILCGIMPLISRKNALFMKNEMAGIQVTEEIAARYPEQGTREEGEAVGIALAKEVMEFTRDFTDGYYFSFPFNRVYLLEKILGEIIE